MDLSEKYDQLYKKYSQLIIVFKAYKETEKKVEQILKRLEKVETKAEKNQEKSMDIESRVKEAKKNVDNEEKILKEHISLKSAEWEGLTKKVQSENINLQRGIHDLDIKLSDLDEEYKLIQSDIQQRKDEIEETNRSVSKLASDLNTIREGIPASNNQKPNKESKCKKCDNSFQNYQELKCHIASEHSNEIKCKLL